jgi:hypothetical protein
MIVVAIIGGVMPIMPSAGTGSEEMQHIAVPMIGGMVSAKVLTLVVIVPTARLRTCYFPLGFHVPVRIADLTFRCVTRRIIWAGDSTKQG